MRELIPQATFFTQVVNHGILGHYVATASLATGVYETFNNFAAVPPQSPTVFEYFRKDLKRPSSDAWVVAPSNGFNRIGESSHRSYGHGLGAQSDSAEASADRGHVGRQQRLSSICCATTTRRPFTRRISAGSEFELQQLETILKLSVDDFKAHARTLSSPDELSVYIARQLMRQVAPSLLWITLHDIDIAHAGAYSLYIDGIRRTDRLCAETLENDPDRAGICRQHHDVYPAGLRARLRRRRGRQRFPASSHRRRPFAHHLDDGAGRRGSGGRGFRPASGFDRSRAYAWIDVGILLRSRRASRSRKCCSIMLPAISNRSSSPAIRPKHGKLVIRLSWRPATIAT